MNPKLNLLLIKHPWTIAVLSILYSIILRGGLALCDIDPRTLYDQINSSSYEYTFRDEEGNYITLYEGRQDMDIIWADKEIHVKQCISPYKYPELTQDKSTSYSSDTESSDTESDQSTSEAIPQSTSEAVPQSTSEAVPQIFEGVDLDNAFLNEIKNLSVEEQAVHISVRLFDKISEQVRAEGAITTVRLKEIVTYYMLRDVTLPLWGSATTMEEAMNDESLAMKMMDFNYFHTGSSNKTNNMIMTHMSAHIGIINTANIRGLDALSNINDTVSYTIVYNSAHK